MARNWNIDKIESLASFEDFELYYFDNATYMDRKETIIASFPNMTPGETHNFGLIWVSGIDPLQNYSISNNPYVMYKDENRQDRIHFYFTSGDTVEDFGVITPEGNIIGDNSKVFINIAGPISLNKEVQMHDVIPAHINPNGTQTLGECWIALTSESPEYGLDWQEEYEQIVNPGSNWELTEESWTDTSITINKSKYWSSDSINR